MVPYHDFTINHITDVQSPGMDFACDAPVLENKKTNTVSALIVSLPVAQNHQRLAPVGGVEKAERVAPLQRRMGHRHLGNCIMQVSFPG